MSDIAQVGAAPWHQLDPGAFGLRAVDCLGVPLLAGSFESATALLEMAAGNQPGESLVVAHINLANLHTLHGRPQLARALAHEAMLFLDGIGLKTGLALMGNGWIDDVNGTDLFPMLMQRLERRRARIYLLGSRPDVVDDAARVTTVTYPGLEVVGWEQGYFADTEHEISAVHRIRDARPDVLLVGCGFGRQEEFVLRHRTELAVPLIWTVGGLFDMLSGHAPRAPHWMRWMRLEWLFRFAREPRRMWYRNVISPPWFFARAMRARLGRRA